MSMPERIRRIERVLATLEGDGHTTESDELRRLFNEYAGEVRHLESRAKLGTVLSANTTGLVRSSELLDQLKPYIDRLVMADEKKATAIGRTEHVKAVLLSKVNSLHILVTVILLFGIVYAIFGYSLPRISDVVSP